ncbi:MAG: efflux RND transporter periplasmic adaptor subunit [candidate division Zixibacteria bacterium]|nr:efflux RND transporter periplasmic adaptor subunit [candidate division Zixibacteria bacterium]
MKKALLVIAVLAVLILLFVIFVAGDNKSEAVFVTAEAQRGDIYILVTATGTVEAVTTVQVGSQVSGTISALYADFNDRVKKGQVVAQLDPTFLKAQMAQVQADLEKAIASVNLSKKEYERVLSLFEKNMISESEKDIYLTNYDLAVAQVKSARAALNRAKTNLEYATIVSPIDGVVISRNVDVGQTVAASLQAPTLFTIAQDLSEMQVKTSIDEADIGRIREEQEVAFTVDAYPDLTFNGDVNQIRLSPEIVQNVVTYDVIIEVANPDLLLKPGMTANVTILVDHAENTLKVPSGALRFRPPMGHEESSSERKNASPHAMGSPSSHPGSITPHAPGTKRADQTVLWIIDQEGKPEPVLVQTGISDGVSTQIISDNLKEGNKVIIGLSTSESSSHNQQVNPFAPQFRRRGR